MTANIDQELRPRILVVSDQPVLCQQLAEQLGSDYALDMLSDVAEVLRMTASAHQDLIIADLAMPERRALALIETLRESTRSATVPILMIASGAADELRLQGFTAGADSFIAVPCTARELQLQVRSMLNSAQRHAAAARQQARQHAATLVEEILQRRGDEFFALADNIPILCWMAYADGRVYWFNRRWHEYTGTAPPSLGRWGWESVHDPKLLPQIKARWKQSLATGEPFEMIFPLKGADGRFGSFLTRVVPIKDPSGTVVRWFGTNTDVSAQLAVEAQLRELTTRLEERVAAAVTEREKALEQLAQARKMETIGQLTGGVAHDFNNLLTPIVGALDLALRKFKGDERAERLAAGALQAAESARTLIQRLLAFSRKQHLEARAVDIGQLLANLSELLASTLGPRIERSIRVEQPLEPAHVDPNQLELALLNLCLNARDAMPEGGALAIGVRAESVADHPRLKPGAYVRISVCDTGSGMDAMTLQRAIEPFFTTKSPGQGTGLGLSMVHGLAAQSGGELVLDSLPGAGTTASLWLPVSTGTPVCAEPTAAAAPNPAVEAHAILLVDDEDMVRQSTAAMLAEAGYRVVEASSGTAALALLDSGARVHAVVTDYTMPRMTGVRLAELIRERRPELPILMITGYANLSDHDANGLPRIAKPFRAMDLARTVGELLNHSARDQT